MMELCPEDKETSCFFVILLQQRLRPRGGRSRQHQVATGESGPPARPAWAQAGAGTVATVDGSEEAEVKAVQGGHPAWRHD
jgi:hypothetical protein